MDHAQLGRITGLILIAGVAASCAGASPTLDATATEPPRVIVAAPTPMPEPGLIAERATIKDPKADLVNEDGKKVAKNPHIDLTRLDASADGTNLRITITVAGKVPAKVSSKAQELNYLLTVEANRSGADDFWIMVTNQEDGEWSPKITDWTTSLSAHGPMFPGSFVVEGNKILINVSLAALGSPSSLRLAAYTQRADHKSGDVLARDQVPKGEQYIPADAWLTLGP